MKGMLAEKSINVNIVLNIISIINNCILFDDPAKAQFALPHHNS